MVRTIAIVASTALLACDTPAGPAAVRDPVSIVATVQGESGAATYRGTGWFESGTRRPAAPVHVLLHTEEEGAGGRGLQILWRGNGNVTPVNARFPLGRDTEVLLYFTVHADGVTLRYAAEAGEIELVQQSDGNLVGSFHGTARLSSVCRSGSSWTRCDVVADGTDTIELDGSFLVQARRSGG